MTDQQFNSGGIRQRTDVFVRDTIRLISALDAVTARDAPGCIAEALHRGYWVFAELLIERDSLRLGQEDDILINWVLDLIAARLRFLRSIHSRNLPN